MYKIMSNHSTYPELHYEALEPTTLVEENVIWESQESDNMQEQDISYADATDCTLTDIGNESYVTASGDNTTQYFSVLESSNQTLNDITDVTINNSIIHEGDVEDGSSEENNFIDVNRGQVVLFKVDGTDELYGFQLIHDEEGNLQKYQFKVRQNIEGNLEAIPETLQILPVDTLDNGEMIDEIDQANIQSFQNVENNDSLDKDHTVIVKQEHNIEHSASELDEEEIFEEPLDSKEGILELAADSTEKQERQVVHSVPPHEYIHRPPSIVDDSLEEEDFFYSHEDTHENTLVYDNVIDGGPAIEEETSTSAGHYEELFVKESHLMDDANVIREENGIQHLNDSETEEYETLEDVHVTGDIEGNNYEDTDIRKSPSYQASTFASRRKIVKNVIRKVRIQKNDGKSNLYYLVKNTEKENVGQIPSNSIMVKPNPRSILKCSVTATEVQNQEEDEEEKYDKRFAKSKEAQQARLFHNFIAQTKIIHAPIRQERLPRKQQIKPMKRTDEEIVVQEVVVSSNGFIETSEEGILKERVPLKPTEYIQLTDSDEDFDPKSPHKRKRKSKRRKTAVEITISDSEEPSSDISTRDADEANSDEVATTIVKRPRGRPPKHHDKDEEKEKETIKRPRGRPPKNPKPQTEMIEEEIIVIKIDNKCPKCPKSFPSEGSLRSHMQYHYYSQTNDTKYICERCGDTFKNSFLLNRHMNSHKTSNIVCEICKKVFSDQGQLAAHKRSHIKQQMFKNTTLPKDSPKVFKNASKNKCEQCNKVFSNISALNLHGKVHKHLFCRNCNSLFTSKFTFGNHLRAGCIKTFRSPRKRPSLRDKRQSPLRKHVIPVCKKEEMVVPKAVPSRSIVITNIKCDSCLMTFATYTSLFKHKVLKHGLDTPDTSMAKAAPRKSLYKSRTAHSGVRPSLGLKNAFAGLQNKLEAFKSTQKKT